MYVFKYLIFDDAQKVIKDFDKTISFFMTYNYLKKLYFGYFEKS